MKALPYISVAVLVFSSAGNQFAQAPTSFEAADVHVAERNSDLSLRIGFYRSGRFEIQNASMADLIGIAYETDPDNVVGGPDWLVADRFEISAKAAPDSTPVTLRTMLRTLLSVRFGLVTRTEDRDLPAYGLVAEKKPLLKNASGSGDTGCRPVTSRPATDDATEPNVSSHPLFEYACTNMTMAAFAGAIHSMAGAAAYVGKSPILDETALTDSWDFRFRFGGPSGPGQSSITLFEALEQLGLRLEPRKTRVAVTVVDRVNQRPTENVPDVAKLLPEVPSEFEAADVKPSDPNPSQVGKGSGLLPSGRVDLRDYTMKTLIAIAWNVPFDRILGGPKFLDSNRFTIVAKAPSAAVSALPGTNFGSSIDPNAIRRMLQTLLAQRFRLATHQEERSIAIYTLTAVKPKLRKANPSNRTGFHEGPGPDGKDPRITNPALSRLVTFQNMTMTQFVRNLSRISPGDIPDSDISSSVVDATGLEGAWDFTLSFSPSTLTSGMGQPGNDSQGTGSAVDAPADPSALTLFDAIEKQLGLKLAMHKQSATVLVIDHVNQLPTEN